MQQVVINVYKYNELNKRQQLKALVSVSRWICQFIGVNSRFNEPAQEVEDGLLVGHLVNNYKHWLIEEIERYDYDFIETGEMYLHLKPEYILG